MGGIIPISALPKTSFKAGVESDKDLSVSLNTEAEVNLAAMKTKLYNNGDSVAYDAFVAVAKQYGYDLAKFPVDEYVKANINTLKKDLPQASDLPLIKKDDIEYHVGSIRFFSDCIFMSKNDRGKKMREQINIVVKPRKTGKVSAEMSGSGSGVILTTDGVGLGLGGGSGTIAMPGETREYIYIEHLIPKGKQPGAVRFLGRDWYYNSEQFYIVGKGEADNGDRCDNQESFPEAVGGKGYFNSKDADKMVKLINLAIESLKSDPKEAKLVKDLEKTRNYISSLQILAE